MVARLAASALPVMVKPHVEACPTPCALDELPIESSPMIGTGDRWRWRGRDRSTCPAGNSAVGMPLTSLSGTMAGSSRKNAAYVYGFGPAIGRPFSTRLRRPPPFLRLPSCRKEILRNSLLSNGLLAGPETASSISMTFTRPNPHDSRRLCSVNQFEDSAIRTGVPPHNSR